MKYKTVLHHITICIIFLTILNGCTKLTNQLESSDVSSITESVQTSAWTDSELTTDTIEDLEPIEKLSDLTPLQHKELMRTLQNGWYFNVDISDPTINILELLYVVVIGPTSRFFLSSYGTGDSEADYRKFIKQDFTDPKKMFSEYGKFPAKNVDFILDAIYNLNPDRSASIYDSKLYYDDEYYYVEWFATGHEDSMIKITEFNYLKKDNNYEISFEVYDSMDPTYLLADGVAILKRKRIDNKEYWSYLNVQATHHYIENENYSS